MKMQPTPLSDKLDYGIDRSGGPDACWPWTMFKQRKGYGIVQMPKKRYLAHRAAYTLWVGPIPHGLFVCHHCDNPPCCNPAHLFLGTARDNALDAVQKGRLRGFSSAGEAHPSARLTLDDVRTIRSRRQSGEAHVSLAAAFGMSYGQIYKICRGDNWRMPEAMPPSQERKEPRR
jgi:hypothetical protein